MYEKNRLRTGEFVQGAHLVPISRSYLFPFFVGMEIELVGLIWFWITFTVLTRLHDGLCCFYIDCHVIFLGITNKRTLSVSDP